MMNSAEEKMGKIKFFRESVKNLKTVGTITRSSKYLCKGMIKPVDFSKAKVIVELGAGDGVVTQHILKRMRKDAILISFELNEKFCKQMRESIEDDRLHIIQDDAAKIKEYLIKFGHSKADAIISAIPFTLLPEEVTYKIVRNSKEVLKANGPFVQMHYSLFLRKIYKNVFGNLDFAFVPLNVPPAWVFTCYNR